MTLGRRRLLLACLPGLLLTLVAGWLAWPLLRPRLWPAAGAPLLVVLDGYHRLDWALQRQARSGEPILLITCPATGQATASQWSGQRLSGRLLVLQQGFDTASQAAALGQWLQQRQQQGVAPPRQLLLVSDAHHFPRASWAFQIAAGGSGSRVVPLMLSNPHAQIWDWDTWRDALRLQLWRATGSTGAHLQSVEMEQKIRACMASP